ncbi:FtsX-like permease family protein [Fulvivirga sp.]|uniref:ABC transporter permease n=1 Tax=Fulvivirga sp. TaxID=1931237 RepID=UPI0032EF723B
MDSPPSLAQKLLEWLIKDELAEEVLGDLDEKYYYLIKNKSTTRAKLNYWYQVFNYLRPFALKNYKSKSTTMYKHNFKIAYRHLLKNRGYTFINIFSLTVGIAACMAIYLFIVDETSFDSQHAKRDHIYRLDEVQTFPGTKQQKVALSMSGMGPAMLSEFPEIASYTRYQSEGKRLLSKNEKNQTIDQVISVDSTFLKIFDFSLISGDRETALNEPNSVLLTEETALKFFNEANDALGNTINMGDNLLKITGILENVPENSHLQFDVLLTLTSITREFSGYNNNFGYNSVNTYLLLESNVDVTGLEGKFGDFMIRHTEDETITDSYTLFLQSLENIHLQSSDIEHDYNNYRKFNGQYIDTFAMVGVFILIIASINFMNLSTARASQRWKEVGVRKAVGAQKIQLFNQFILESILLAVLAMVLAFAINMLAIPWLNDAINRKLTMWFFIDQPQSLLIAFAITLGLGILTGLYPSLYLTAFKAINVLKGNKQNGNKSVFRSGLVVLQFGLALAMIVSTLIVLNQLNYMKNKDVGFDKDQIVLIDMNREVNEKFELIKNELLDLSAISGVTASGQRLGNNFHQGGFKVKMDSGIFDFIPSNLRIEYDYFDVYGIKLKEGRKFSKEFATDEGLAYIINETMVKELGLKSPIGVAAAHSWYPDDSLGTIIGVVEDFNFNSLHHKVNTLSMSIHSNWGFDEMSVKIKGSDPQAALAQIEDVWNRHIKDWPFDYMFLDEHFATLYQSDNQMSAVVSIMTVLAILIACMGLFGLSSIMVMQKIKEVGIRKVLGANAFQITFLLSRNFLLLVVLAFIIASPITYYLLDDWLQNFAFHVDINFVIFIVGALISLAIALVTIGYHTIKASYRNPVEALRYE